MEGAARTLARAFYDDPSFSWVWRRDDRRLRQLERGFALTTRRLYLDHGECLASDDMAGVALWVPPGWRVSALAQLRLLPAMAAICGRELPRTLRTMARVDGVHPHERHFYLPFVGVLPEDQGRGLGSALMQPVLERCDAQGIPAYLEATSPRNLTLYERHGFEVMEELVLGKDAPPVWTMWREPAG